MAMTMFAAATTMLSSCVSLSNKLLSADKSHTKCLESNFDALDGVFLADCSVCAVNLKKMWCEYACNPEKASFGKLPI